MVKWKKYYSVILISLVLFAIDQVVKYIALNAKFDLLFYGIGLSFTTNTGAGFSIFKDKVIFLIFINLMIIAFLVYLIIKEKLHHKMEYFVPLCLIMSGALSNFIDRFARGFVVDYLSIGTWWPIFNLADSMVVIGGAILIYVHYFRKNGKKRN